MKKILFFGLCVIFISGMQPVRAECDPDPCEPAVCDPCGPNLFGGRALKKSLWFWGGHVETGLYANEYGRKDTYLYTGDMFSGTVPGNTGHLLNVRNTGMQVNQAVFSLGRNIDARHGWDFGGRIDYAFGTDALVLQSRGLEYGNGHGRNMAGNHVGGRWGSGDYFSTLAQVLFEAGYKNLNVRVGKFLNPMGHESALATHHFFYSLTDAFGILPKTQTGVLATYAVNKKLSVFGGWTQGYDSQYSMFLNNDDLTFDTSHNNAFLFGLRYDMNKRTYFRYAAMVGRDTDGNFGVKDDRNYFVQSFIVGYKPGKRWDYTFEWTLRNERDEITDARQYWGAYGINQELIYKINDRWSLGGRAEWSHFYQSTHGTGAQSFGLEKYTFTVGLNWTPTGRLLIRPEIRYDKFDGDFDGQFREKGPDGRARDKQLSGGFSMIVKF